MSAAVLYTAKYSAKQLNSSTLPSPPRHVPEAAPPAGRPPRPAANAEQVENPRSRGAFRKTGYPNVLPATFQTSKAQGGGYQETWGCHTARHSFAIHLLEDGCDPRDPSESFLGDPKEQVRSLKRGVIFLAVVGPLFSLIGLYSKGWLPIPRQGRA